MERKRVTLWTVRFEEVEPASHFLVPSRDDVDGRSYDVYAKVWGMEGQALNLETSTFVRLDDDELVIVVSM